MLLLLGLATSREVVRRWQCRRHLALGRAISRLFGGTYLGAWIDGEQLRAAILRPATQTSTLVSTLASKTTTTISISASTSTRTSINRTASLR